MFALQTQESARQCLYAGTELSLLGQTLDVYKALNKDQLQEKADLKHATHKSKDSRNLYLVKEGGQCLDSKETSITLILQPLEGSFKWHSVCLCSCLLIVASPCCCGVVLF